MEPGSSRPGQGRHTGASAGLRSGSAEGLDTSVILVAPGWRAAIKQPEALARRAAGVALREAGAAGAVTVLLADDTTVKRLNGTHRAKAKPTNVLSFPGGMPGYLGDVALAFGVVQREARGAGRRVAAHFA
ncbi:MAG: rRNA maturation RNAse YbeY, partial [Alphaproteobacteria bacterium]